VITLPRIRHVNDVECDCHPAALLPTGSFVKLPENLGRFTEILAADPSGAFTRPIRWMPPCLSHHDELGAALRCIPGAWVYMSPEAQARRDRIRVESG
jgi:hypothetical protein